MVHQVGVLEQANLVEELLMPLLPVPLLHLLSLECVGSVHRLSSLILRQHNLLVLLYLIEAEGAIVHHLLELAMELHEQVLMARHDLQLSFYLEFELAHQHLWIDLQGLQQLLVMAKLFQVVNLYSHYCEIKENQICLTRS